MLSNILKYELDVTKRLFSESKNKRDDSIKQQLKSAVDVWPEEQDVTGYINIEDFHRYPYKNYLRFGAIGIHNNFGSVTKGNKWLNKIIIQADYGNGNYPKYEERFKGWRIRTHKVTTDPKYLAPFNEIFLHFVEEMTEYLKA